MMYNSIMAKRLTPEEKAQREIDRQAELVARKAARAAATLQRRAAKKQEIEAQRLAAREAQRAAWEAEKQQRRVDFRASLSDADWADLQLALELPSSRIDEHGHETITNEWLHSVKGQFAASGVLSPRQLDPLLRQVRKRREQAQAAEVWPTIKEGDVVKMRCTIVDATVEKGVYGTCFKIRMLTHYGRKCSMKTTRQDWFALAQSFKQEGKKAFVQATIKWIAPDKGGPFVLTSRGAKFGDLL